MVDNQGYILHKVVYEKGRKHDYDIYKKNHHTTLKEVITIFNLGYLCIEKDFPKQLFTIPQKKNINSELSQEEKEYNKIHS